MDSFHRSRTKVQQVFAGVTQRQHTERANQEPRGISPLSPLEVGTAKRRNAATPKNATIKERKTMRQVPARFIHSLFIKAVLEASPDAIQVSPNAKLGYSIVEIVRHERALGIQGRKASRISENSMRPFK